MRTKSTWTKGRNPWSPRDESGNIPPVSSVFRTADYYAPQPKQLAFHQAKAKYKLQTGGAGSGKSLALLWEAIDGYCLRYPGSQSLLLRKNYPELEKGLIADFKAMVPQHIYSWHESKHIATFVNGSQLYFGHCENGSEKSLSQYLSSAFVFIGIDEAGQFSFEAWDFLKARNRVNGGCEPSPLNGRMPEPGMALATNPMGPGWGWIKALWVDRRHPPQSGDAPIDFADYWYVHSTILDNPIHMRRDPAYVASLKGLAPNLRKKFLDGDLNSISGQYYANFDLERHVIDLKKDPDRIIWQKWQPAWVGLDWGIAHHTVALWFTRGLLRKLDGTRTMATVCYREMAVNETSIGGIAKLMLEMSCGGPFATPEAELKALKNVYVSHELFARRSSPNPDQTVGAELSRELRANGLPEAERAAGSASARERIDAAVMIYEHLEDGDLVFLTECELLCRSVPTLARDERDPEDVVKSATLEDDLFDALKHGILSVMSDRRKPNRELVLEHAATVHDPLARWFYLTKNMPRPTPAAVQPNVVPAWELAARRALGSRVG